MSHHLLARDLAMSFAARTLFTGVSLTVSAGDRIGLIGPNGTGKSTLLRLLAGLEIPDEGSVVRPSGSPAPIYVPQDDVFPAGATAHEVVASAVRDAGAGDAAGTGRGPSTRLDPDTTAATALSRLGFADPECDASILSGGWRKRLAIARAIAFDPTVLLLDEPTNHLDLDGVRWLEGFVRQMPSAVIFVTHDRHFLETVATRIVELSPAYPGGTFSVDGNYSEFVRRKDAFLEAQAKEATTLANAVRRDTAWLRQGIQGRQTRNKTQVADAARRRDELAATTDRMRAPDRRTDIDFNATERRTRKLVELTGVDVGIGDHMLLHGLDLRLTPGQRVGLVGANGTGKTTLLRVIAGEHPPAGGSIDRADDLRVVTFSQHRTTLDPDATLHVSLCPVGDTVETPNGPAHVSGWAKRFLFRPDQLKSRIRDLSGGEQARVLIAQLMLEPADVLLLDEPTNDLDIPSLEVLESALTTFPGAVVLITHDRFMLERVATEYVGLDGRGGARAVPSLEQWERWLAERDRADAEATWASAKKSPAAAAASDAPADASSASPAAGPRKLTYKLQREFDGMEAAILEAEEALEARQAEAADPGLAQDHERAAAVYRSLESAQGEVDRLYARWAELEAMQRGGG